MSADESEGGNGLVPATDLDAARERRADSHRAEVMSLLMAGMTYEQIGTRLGVTRQAVERVVARAAQAAPDQGVTMRRYVENARLDRAQAAIWAKVLDGDHKAISSFLAISARRARLNGMDAPMEITVSAHVRVEMEAALSELQALVLGIDEDVGADVWDAEVVGDADGDEGEPSTLG
jgi:hypothetical protein